MITAFTLAALLPLFAPQAQDSEVQFLSPHAAVRSTPTHDQDQLEFYDSAGRLVSAVLLRSRSAVAGPSGVALVELSAIDGARRADYFDDGGIMRGAFDIPPDRELVVGRESVALVPRSLHQPGTALDIQFLSLDGTALSTHSQPNSILAGIDSDTNGRFLAHSLDSGLGTIRAYDARGDLLWAWQSKQDGLVRAALSPSGRHAVVWTVSDDRSTSSLHLLDADGQELNQLEIGAVHSAAFSADERTLVLTGWDMVAVIDVPTRQVSWVSTLPLDQPPGPALLVSNDGRRVTLLTRLPPDASLVAIRTIVRTSSDRFDDTQKQLSGISGIEVITGFSSTANTLRLTTPTKQWNIAP